MPGAPAPKQAPPPQLPPGKIINQEQRVEYRDAAGNILDDEQVKELKGKVQFEVSPLIPFQYLNLLDPDTL